MLWVIYHNIESIQGGQLETAETEKIVIGQKFLLKGTPEKDHLYNKTGSTIRSLHYSNKVK